MKKAIKIIIIVVVVIVLGVAALGIYSINNMYGTWKCTNPEAVPECPITQFTITKGTVACEMIRVKDGTAVTENGVFVDAGMDVEGSEHILLYDEDNNDYHMVYTGVDMTLSFNGTDLVYKK